MKKFKLLPLSIAVQMAMLANVAYALEDNADSITIYGHYIVDEKIDTATGLGLSLFETPQSVSVMTEQRILDQNLNSIAEVITQTVGVSANNLDTTRNTFSARGFDIDKYQIDGVPQAWSLAGDSGETIADVSIYERIEVVRGATGLLTGAGDPSASINLVRKHADSDVFKGYVNGGFGRWNSKFISADLSTPLNESGSVRARVVAKKKVSDTFMDIPDEDKSIVYGVLDADLGENTSLSVGSSYQDSSPTGSTWGALAAWFTDGTPTHWDRSVTTSTKWTHWDTTNSNTFATLTHEFSNGWEGKVSYNHTKNTATTKLLYVSGTLDKTTGEGLNPWPYNSDGFNTQDSVDIQIKGTYQLFDRDHEFVVGALKSEQRAETSTFAALSYQASTGNFYEWDGSYPEAVWAPNSIKQSDLDTDQDGYYLATRLSLTDALKFIVGGRVSKWEQKGFDWGVDKNYGNDNVFVPYAGLTYDVGGNHNLYASYTEIFKPQNAQDINRKLLDPVEGSNTEIGFKSNYLDGKFQTAVAVFLIKQDNLAQLVGRIPNTTPPQDYYREADGTESKGFELEAIGQLTDSWTISAGYAQYKAEDAVGLEVNTDHPRKKLNLFTTYDLNNLLAGFVVGGGVTWESERHGGTDPSAMLRQDAYSLVSLMARYSVSDNLSVQANVENALDETYYSQVGFYNEYTYGSPRNFTLGVTYSF